METRKPGLRFFTTADVHMHDKLPVWIEKAVQWEYVDYHSHEFIEIAFVAGGSTLLEHHDLKGNIRQVGLVQGDLFSVLGKEGHLYANGEKLILYNIYLLPKFVAAYSQLLSVAGWRLLFGGRESSNKLVLHLSAAEREKAIATLDQAVWESRTQPPGFEVMLTALILNFLIEACRSVDMERQTVLANDMGVLRSIRVIEDEPARSFQLKELAGIARMSVPTYTRKFRAATGLSPMGYIHKLRLQQVCYYLMTTDRNIGEIAQLCGFCTPNYLIKLFRRTYGKTPVEYRKQWTRFPRPYDSE